MTLNASSLTIKSVKIFILIGLLCTLTFVSSCQKKGSSDLQEVPPIKANLVFLYYRDLPNAQSFYEEVLGLPRVLDYGFATIHRASPTFYVGLVDESKGMHRATEPKTVTLSFVTNEIDEWYNYLVSKNVEVRRPVRDLTRIPVRGFVAYDPEGYFLEFETYLENPQNKILQTKLEAIEAIYPGEDNLSSRPQNLGLLANVVWLYHYDVEGAQKFYEEKLGAQLLVDQGFTKVYSSSETGYIGIVDQAEGLHKFNEEKAVTVAFISNEVDAWYERLSKLEVKMRGPIGNSEREPVRAFVGFDPAGYYLEFDWFLDDPKNEKLLELLGP